jgi:hypothetical protein
MKQLRFTVMAAALAVLGARGTASAQLVPPESARCINGGAPTIGTERAQRRYAWASFCAGLPDASRGHYSDGSAIEPAKYLSAASTTYYTNDLNTNEKSRLFPVYFDFVGGDWQIPDSLLTTGPDWKALPTDPAVCRSTVDNPPGLFPATAIQAGVCAASITAGRCADGTQEQVFFGGMVGCAGAVTYANRGALCAAGFRPVTAAEWTTLRHGLEPTHDYWTADDLKYTGSGPAACSVSAETGNSCGATPMRVCTAAGTDPEGNQCNWQHCGLDANTPDQFFGGCVGNTTAGTLCIVGGCADGSVEQTFAGGMVGCAAAATYANRDTLCGPGYRVATAAEWAALHNGVAPTHNYWTSDALKYSGIGSSSCFVSTTVGNDCGPTPMRVCSGADPEGNLCNWTHCGLEANAPDQFFGGCVGNVSAGALCVPNMGCADGSVEQVFANGMIGCAGSVAFASRDALCAPGYQPATSAQWVANRGSATPTHDYWTDESLKWSGTGPSACFVSTTVGNDTCGTSPMRVCTATGGDGEGNTCNWTHCGLGANAPDQFFGGCATNAGTLCIH